ncbi:CHAT domain-containing protein [Nostoc sp. CENA67]|uniref:CHAT domain-containing protein n=1 Tax=Amazonocrinis nigriterrae CENA67 TaxID=2794033 RepID=A0A8J7I2P7_9NOST|nr:CHAT domain-containing protein [Amazonocrinis nigriterrae CENA67]
MRSLILAVLLFFLSVGGVLFTTHVWASTAIVLTPQQPLQLVEQGKMLYQNRQFESALKVWEQVAAAFAARDDKLNQAMALSNLSLTAQQLGKWEQAKQAIATSLNILQTQPETSAKLQILSSTLDIQGQLQLAVGESQAALATWQQAAEIYQNIGNQNGAIRSQINQAQAMQDLGLYPRACKTLLKALELEHQKCQITKEQLQTLKERISNKKDSFSLDILALRSLGNVLRFVSQLEQSQMVLLTAGQLAQQSGDSQNFAAIYLSLGNIARALAIRKIQLETPRQQAVLTESLDCMQAAITANAAQLYQQATTCYRQAELSISSEIKRQAQLNRFSLLVQTQQWSEVPKLLSDIQTSFNNLPASHSTVYAEIKFAQSLMCLQSRLSENSSNNLSPILQLCSFTKNPPTSIGAKSLESATIPSWAKIGQILQTALNQAQQLGDKQAQADVRGYLGGIYQQMGKLAQAQQLTEQALQQKSAFNNSSITYLWQWQLGRIYQTQQDQKSALQAYTLAYETLQSLRQDLVGINPEIQFTFRDSVEPVYRELVNLLLQPVGSQQINQTEISQENLQKARDVIEALQLAELTNFFREACVTSQPQPIDQLDPNAAVIYSVILPNRLALILSRPQKPLKYHATPLVSDSQPGKTGEVERVFDDMFTSLNPYISDSNSLRAREILYEWLIRPVEAELQKDNVKTLVFVLDGVLRGVPMSALYDHQNQKYLIEKYNLALSPGLQLLYSRSLSPNKLQTLAGGLAEARQGFSKLPGVEEEVRDIAEIVPTEVLLNQEFTRKRIKEQIDNVPFPIVHLATHGQFSSQVENTFLLTWDGRINVKELDELLQARDRPGRSPLELLILSACQTAAGDQRAVLGLAGVAVRSGARSTLATLWSVQDESTVELMNKFYSELNQPGVTKAVALRTAQLFLLRSPKYRHPYYWAPFVLVGNWL